jgi:hypothetical protein
LPHLPDDIGCACDVSGVIEDRIAQKNYVAHGCEASVEPRLSRARTTDLLTIPASPNMPSVPVLIRHRRILGYAKKTEVRKSTESGISR